MAGSYKHITNENNEFIGCDLLENLGDAYEALEECYYFIQFFSNGDKTKIAEAHADYLIKRCPHYEEKNRQELINEYWDKE